MARCGEMTCGNMASCMKVWNTPIFRHLFGELFFAGVVIEKNSGPDFAVAHVALSSPW